MAGELWALPGSRDRIGPAGRPLAYSGEQGCASSICATEVLKPPDHANLYAVGVRWPNLGYAGASSIRCVHAGVLRNTPPVIRSHSCE
jgi:hypothetical protein